jgi:hypothetical protein
MPSYTSSPLHHKTQGDEIRALKDSGADKTAVKPFVDELLSLKAKLEPPAEPKKKVRKEGLQRTPCRCHLLTHSSKFHFILATPATSPLPRRNRKVERREERRVATTKSLMMTTT